MTWKLLTWPPLILVLLLCPIEDSSAQTTTSGGLGGVVRDPSGAVVPGALVELRDNAKGTVHLAKTDSDGAYRFFFLAPGKYTLKVVHESFREKRHEISVVLGPPSTRNVSLELAGSSSTVKVMDEMPLLQAENGDVSTTMNQRQVSQVPNPGNDLTYIAQTAPGAIMNTDTIGAPYVGNFSIGPTPEIGLKCDGLLENKHIDELSGSRRVTVGLDRDHLPGVDDTSGGSIKVASTPSKSG